MYIVKEIIIMFFYFNVVGVELVMNIMLDRFVFFDDIVLFFGGRVVDFI